MHNSIDYDGRKINNHDGKLLAIFMSVALNFSVIIDIMTMVIVGFL